MRRSSASLMGWQPCSGIGASYAPEYAEETIRVYIPHQEHEDEHLEQIKLLR